MLDIRGQTCYIVNVKQALHYGKEGGGLKNRIEALRNANNVRQDELAKAMRVSRQTISSLENGRYNPSILLAYKIARYFGLTIEEVFIFEEE